MQFERTKECLVRPKIIIGKKEKRQRFLLPLPQTPPVIYSLNVYSPEGISQRARLIIQQGWFCGTDTIFIPDKRETHPELQDHRRRRYTGGKLVHLLTLDQTFIPFRKETHKKKKNSLNNTAIFLVVQSEKVHLSLCIAAVNKVLTLNVLCRFRSTQPNTHSLTHTHTPTYKRTPLPRHANR